MTSLKVKDMQSFNVSTDCALITEKTGQNFLFGECFLRQKYFLQLIRKVSLKYFLLLIRKVSEKYFLQLIRKVSELLVG